MTNMQILKSAYEKKSIKQDFTIPLAQGQAPMQVSLVMDDFYALNDEMKAINATAYAKYAKRGLDEVKPPRRELKEYFDSLPDSTRDHEKKNAPETHAELLAAIEARNNLVFYLIPRFLVDQKTGEKICENDKDEDTFRKIIRSNLDLSKVLIENFTELYKKINETQELIKNLEPPENSKN